MSEAMRSLLFVPGDDPRKIEKALASEADALLLDLEDSVAPPRKSEARRIVADCIAAARTAGTDKLLIVRVNALGTGLADADLDAVMPAAPFGVLLPKCRSGADVNHLAAKLAVREAECALPDGETRIIALATETAGSLFQMGSYAGCNHRLIGLTWGAEDLSADLGAETNRDARGDYTDPYRLARAMTILAAAAAEVGAIDAVYPNFRDLAGFRAEAETGRRDGFSAKMAIHPAQVPIINQVFTPSAEAVAHAEAVIAAFAVDPQTGVVSLDGTMVDRPHLRQAERIMARARASGVA